MKKNAILLVFFFSFTTLSILWAKSHISQKSQSTGGTNTMETKSQAQILELTPENAQMVIANAPNLLIIDFYAEWCGPCKTLKPIFEEIATEFKDQYLFAKINIDTCKNIATEYQITSIPTIALFSNGKLVEKITGLVSKETLLEKIEIALKGPQDLSQLSKTDLSEKLLQAIQNQNKIEDIKRLLDAGADANYTAANGLMPLGATIFMYGTRGADASELIKLLLSCGARTGLVNAQTGETIQASEVAVMMGQNLKNLAANYDKMAALLAETQNRKS